ncbi:hypothetical protein ACFP1I_07640 [Dyadobacter subterraneus]|uniref:TANFOR domain-containing protein n=1 Tax=Dyadobacter subterraneus TaxID=2773304 RepID=A0ABR9WER7_9BACT|nr:hypothetical protein [Dyadobacter subterraneus]MBE9463994.1 hypothetical protein [Dyadobacter subterraneus]
MNSEEILAMEFLSKIILRISHKSDFGFSQLVLLLLLSFYSMAQDPVRITTNVLPPYSPYIQDYPGTGNRVQVFISNLSGRSLSVRLLGKLEGDNGVVIKTSANYRPLQPQQLLPTDVNRLITRNELEGLFDLNQIEVQGMDKNLLYRGFPLPEGNYQLCVQAFDNATIRPLSAEFPMGCSGLIPVRVIEPPILIFPQPDAEVTANTPQTQIFTWTAPVGILPNQIEYTLRIVELPISNIDPNVFIDAVALPKSGIEIKNLKTTTFLYGPQHPPLQAGKRYAWRVQAVPVNGRFNILNDGKSPVQSFTYGKFGLIAQQPGIEIAQAALPVIPGLGSGTDTTKQATKYMLSSKLPVQCSCQVPVNESDNVDNSTVLKSRKATIAGFQMELLANVKEEKGALTGTGMIPVPMINNSYVKMRVNLFDVQCNAQGQVIGGFVRAIYKNGAPGYTPDYDKPEMPALEMTPATMQNLSGFFSTAKDQLVSSLTNSAKSVGFELPLGIDKTFGPVNTVIAITNMTFTPKEAFFDANTWINTANALVSGIPLSGYNMCFSPQKPCGEGILYLAKKMELSPFFALKGAEGAPVGPDGVFGGPDTTQVTHVVFDQSGFKQMRVHGLLTPPGLVDAQTQGKVEISVNAGLVNFQDWTAQLSFPKFYVEGLSDFKFSMQPGKPALYDHSESKTPAKLPEGYLSGPEVNLWQGLYFPEIDLELPSFMKRSDGKPLTVGVQDMISDNNGFSGKAFVKNIVAIDSGSLDSWYFSVDELSVSFLKSTFQNSSMNGKIVLPVFKTPTDAASQLPYSCTLSKEEQNGALSVLFQAKPTEEMNVDIWRAKLKLDNTSTVSVTYNGQGAEAKAVLTGALDIDAEYFTIPAAKFQELTLSSKAPYVSLKDAKFGFASPQKMMEDFPLTLKSGELVSDPVDPKLIGFKFVGALDLTGGGDKGLSATAGATLFFKTGLENGRPNWDFAKIKPDTIAVDAPLGPVHVKGSLAFYKNDEIYGNGIAGNVEMTVTGLVGGKVAARFGRTNEKAGGFRYWYIGGKISIGATGIPFAPPSPLVLRSFGGGLYSNVTRKVDANGEILYVPKPDVAIGFNALVGIGLVTPDVLTMEGDMTLEFSNGSLGKMALHVGAWLLGESKSSSFAQGDGNVEYDFENKIFDANLNLGASYKVPAITISAEVKSTHLHFDSQGLWFLSMGVPTDRVSLNIDMASLADFTFGSYFMLGNYNGSGSNLPADPFGFLNHENILKELNYKNQNSQTFKDGSPLIAFGAGYSLDSDFGVGPFHLRYGGAIGFDLALSKTNDKCNGVTPGINNWYAMGQMYAYMHMALDLDIDTWVYEGTFTVVELEAAALLRGGMVNPVWLNGHVLLKYRVLGGLVKGKVNLEFWYNKGGRCEPTFAPPNPFAGQPLIASLGPSGTDEEVSILSPFYAEFNYPVQSDLIIDLEIPGGQKVEAGTQGSVTAGPNGSTILHREFQLKYKDGFTAKVTKIGAGYANCESDNTGRISYDKNEDGDPNYSATFYRYNALLPKSSYDLSLDLQVFIRDKGKMTPYVFKGSYVEQKETVSFRTGPCISVLSKGTSDQDPILTSYPYEGQRYFMKGDAAETFIKLKTNMSCCMTNLNSDENFDLKVRFTPLEGTTFADDKTGSVLLAGAEFLKDKVTYQLPAGLKNKTLYRFELVRIPKPAFVKEQFASMQKAKELAKKFTYANIYKAVNSDQFQSLSQNLASNNKFDNVGMGAKQGPAVNAKYNGVYEKYTTISSDEYEKIAKGYGTETKINVSTEKFFNDAKFTIKISSEFAAKQKDQEQFGKSLEVKMYRYYFKTSQFNTLNEKIMAAEFPQTETLPLGKLVDALTGKMTSKEGFDSYEMETEFLGGDNYRPPLVLLRADMSSNWFKSIADPVADLLVRIPPAFYSNVDKTRPFETKQTAVDVFRRSMVNFNNMNDQIQKPFKNEEILNLIPSEKKKAK